MGPSLELPWLRHGRAQKAEGSRNLLKLTSDPVGAVLRNHCSQHRAGLGSEAPPHPWVPPFIICSLNRGAAVAGRAAAPRAARRPDPPGGAISGILPGLLPQPSHHTQRQSPEPARPSQHTVSPHRTGKAKVPRNQINHRDSLWQSRVEGPLPCCCGQRRLVPWRARADFKSDKSPGHRGHRTPPPATCLRAEVGLNPLTTP